MIRILHSWLMVFWRSIVLLALGRIVIWNRRNYQIRDYRNMLSRRGLWQRGMWIWLWLLDRYISIRLRSSRMRSPWESDILSFYWITWNSDSRHSMSCLKLNNCRLVWIMNSRYSDIRKSLMMRWINCRMRIWGIWMWQLNWHFRIICVHFRTRLRGLH